MAMIKCPECGKEISDRAVSCPNCGCPISSNVAPTNFNGSNFDKNANNSIYYNEKKLFDSKKQDSKQKISKLGLISIILSALGCTFVFGLVCAIRDIRTNDGTSKRLSWYSIVICGFWLFILFIASFSGRSSTDTADTLVVQEENVQSQSDLAPVVSVTEPEPENDITSQDIVDEPAIEVFALELIENWEQYVEKSVTTSFVYGSCYEKDKKIYSDYFSDYDTYERVAVYLKDYTQFNEGEYITITGYVRRQEAYGYAIEEAELVSRGEISENQYLEAKEEYDERKRIEAEEYEEEFKTVAESPTYDDLLRYPDTYKEKKIKIKAKIVRVEPDGLIFDGDIEATMSGETIALYDGRKVKEPKLREGDSVTIYGYGKGTTIVKVQDVSGWLPKTVDKYSIPAIDIRYIEFN